ncbi:hypothetical protein KAFR_0C03350 [Kazachstania africana CBS 2517]|uniref:DNA mismatch repair proteins mutS family domain-containing protein n=1 Tax=Kazachstania africana (strain ATCC 22294 / BCRC 22015 / CBS 2517 / CECT 1963 / NBRC 1671 / NRRL Y-8276) TaxID=1071382 RepID=H2ASH7_KAZAF|nr:hypothetical protein KAFR_0C03350 [Kazachstania africana CBS 2517]CCF57327.1 hypothetical protein KAFR_0C03350 [Kazachstania africana CBS 2517]
MSSSNLSSFINQKCFERSGGNYIGNSAKKPKLSPKLTRDGSRNREGTFKGRRLYKRNVQTGESPSFYSSCLTGTRYADQIMTNTTAFTSAVNLSTFPDRILCVIYECSKDIETRIGICTVNYNLGQMIFSEFVDSQIFIRTIHHIQIHQPTEIFLPSSSLAPTVSKLATLIKLNVAETVKLCEGPLKYFSTQCGISAINKLSIVENTKDLLKNEMLDKTYALAAIGAAVKYTDDVVKKSNNEFYHYSHFRMRYECSENTVLIDPKTIRGLELVENKIDKKGITLWSFLDKTSTKMGKRLLRSSILQPLTDNESISRRLEAVSELQKQQDVLELLRNAMKSYQDLDLLFSKLLSLNHTAIQSQQKINYVLLLKETIVITKTLQTRLEHYNMSNLLLSQINDILCNKSISEVGNLIDEYINEDCIWAKTNLELQNQRSYAVKCGANGLLDISRQIYKSIIDELLAIIENLSSEFSVELLHSFDAKRGFFIKISRSKFSDVSMLPPVFINKVTKRTYFECSTLEIIKMNARLKEVMLEITILSEEVVDRLLKKTVKKISVLFMLSEAVSLLDLLCCFAFNSSLYNYCIPRFTNTLFIEESRHPVLETSIKNFVSNRISSMKQSSSLQIVTGCNMSGKSLYLKQIALLCIMAQMGSPIPAKSALFPIFTKIHARVCNDTMELTSSNFAFEMKEMAYFLCDTDDKTLMVLDELGRGSSIGDGFAISMAFAEYLLKTKSTVFLSTHFQDIPKLLSTRAAVVHLHMQTDVTSGQLTMHYKVCQSPFYIENSGLRVVKNLFKPIVLEEAHTISAALLKNKKDSDETQKGQRSLDRVTLTNQMKKIHNLVNILEGYSIQQGRILNELKGLQNEFIHNFDSI